MKGKMRFGRVADAVQYRIRRTTDYPGSSWEALKGLIVTESIFVIFPL